SAAPAVKAYMLDPKTYDGIRPTAIDVYSMLATDDSALDALWKFVKDEKEEQQIRLAGIIAYGRLARTAAQAKPLADMAAQYEEKSKRAEEKLKEEKTDEGKARAEEERATAAFFRDALNESQQRITIASECAGNA